MAKAIALGALAILLLVLVPADAARSDDVAASRCSEGHGFSLDEPEGWMCKRTSDNTAEAVEQVAIWPAHGPGTIAIDLTMFSGDASQVTPEQVVERTIWHRLLPPGPPDIRPFEAEHPRLRTACAITPGGRKSAKRPSRSTAWLSPERLISRVSSTIRSRRGD
ncbi:MAG: hypothetical protein JRF70_17105 [Deltaproteobacteria bacterium]|nr:hypothetical protein [Deltaproteobacteria bacterium]